jgi:homoserine dehydrogenase
MKEIKIGICGWGNIATGLYKSINDNSEIINNNSGLKIVINCIGARRDNAACDPGSVKVLRDIFDVVNEDVDAIVELIGGVETARELILAAIRNNKHVITANKAVIYHHGDEIFQAAREKNVKVLFEAAVCAGTPVIKVLQNELAGNHISKIAGMLNGTTNFILSQMEEGADFESTLKIAQDKGYAEPDPSFDIDGLDAAHKLGILSHIAFGTNLPPKDFYIEGISKITGEDFKHASELGYSIKHLAVAKSLGNKIEIRAHPALLINSSILASLKGVRNGIEIDSDLVGKLHIAGSGAGQESTASGLISDIIHLASNGSSDFDTEKKENNKDILDINNLSFQNYFYIESDDKNLISSIKSIVNNHNVAIEKMIQKDNLSNNLTPIFFITELCTEPQANMLLNEIKGMDTIEKVRRIRIESD